MLRRFWEVEKNFCGAAARLSLTTKEKVPHYIGPPGGVVFGRPIPNHLVSHDRR